MQALTKAYGSFKDEPSLKASDAPLTSTVFLNSKSYNIGASDSGNGIQLNNSNWANPITDPQVAINKNSIAGLQVDNPNDQTDTTYTLLPTDAEDTNKNPKTIWMSNAAANTVTIDTNANQAIKTNALIGVMQEGAGITSIQAAAGVLLNGIDGGSVAINAQYAGVTLVKRATDTWIVTGNIGTVA